MIDEGQIVLFRFPQTDQNEGKLRPALVLRKLPGQFDDWLITMISSQPRHMIADFDEAVRFGDPDFELSGLKVESVIRIARLAVVSRDILTGKIGAIDSGRLLAIKKKLGQWITS
jgi:mRNA interferase MazF